MSAWTFPELPLEPEELATAPRVIGTCAYCGLDIIDDGFYCTEYYEVDGVLLHEGHCFDRYVHLNFYKRSDDYVPE